MVTTIARGIFTGAGDLKKAKLEGEAASQATQMPLPMVLAFYCAVSTGMMIFNKLSLALLPPMTLVGIQAMFAVVAMLCTHVELGSFSDQRRFMVVPVFFCGMLAFSALTLHRNSMTFLIVFRSCTPIVSLGMERAVFRASRPITPLMVLALVGAVFGAVMYVYADYGADHITFQVLMFCFANMFMAAGDRVANRWVVSERPVKINNEGMVLINNAVTAALCLAIAWRTHEHEEAAKALAGLRVQEWCYVLLSCIAGAMLGVAAFATQRRITATDMQVLINANKIGVIVFEVLFMHKVLAGFALAGCLVALGSGAVYSFAVTTAKIEETANEEETKRLLADNKDWERRQP